MSVDVIISSQSPTDPSFLTCKVYFVLLSDDSCQVSLSKVHSSKKDGSSGLSRRLVIRMMSN